MKKSIIIILIFICIICVVFLNLPEKQVMEKNEENIVQVPEKKESIVIVMNNTEENRVKLDDWRITLVNKDNLLPENYQITLADIDDERKFDSRAINYLNDMLEDMKNDVKDDFWVQSAYRDPEYQEKIFNEKKQEYLDDGLSEERAELLTSKTINKPLTSEHNLGLSVDFNYVNTSFDETDAFKWLQENAEKYGFILRYKKEKEDITKIIYEPWHWRFVGEEHAKKMNELDMCLEEYIDYLNK